MLTLLQTLLFLFGTAFVLGFFVRDIETILNTLNPATEGAPSTPPAPAESPPADPIDPKK